MSENGGPKTIGIGGWFEICRAGIVIDGVSNEPHRMTVEDLDRMAASFTEHIPVIDGHELTPETQRLALIGNLHVWDGGLWARLAGVTKKFLHGCAHGRYFGRSIGVTDGVITHLCIHGVEHLSGAGIMRPLHFLDKDAFDDPADYEHNRAAIEERYVAADARLRREHLDRFGITDEGAPAGAIPADFKLFTWTPPEDPDLAGIVIRYGKKGDEWGVMTPLHNGVLTASPHESIDPEMGSFEFSARAISTAGEISMETRVEASLTGTRIGGQQWSSGSGDPADDTARDGAFYLDTASGNLWQRQEGAWVKVSNVQAADGAQWYNGADAPGNNLGKDGDWYLQTGTGAVAGTVYAKAAGAWVKQFDIDSGQDGATWLSGTAEPGNSLGKVGDFYFRSANGYVYQKTAATTWSFLRDITGPAGVNGSVWHSTAGIPAAGVGADGDFALDVNGKKAYRKVSGSWVEQVDFAGADGAQWHSGSGAPAAATGKDGDWYFRTGSGAVAAEIYRKVSGSWVKQVDIDKGRDGTDGDDGSVWHTGTGAPSGSLGVVGDWYFRSSNGYVYEKTGSSTWTFRQDITGPQGPQGATGPIGPAGPREWQALYNSSAALPISPTTTSVSIANRGYNALELVFSYAATEGTICYESFTTPTSGTFNCNLSYSGTLARAGGAVVSASSTGLTLSRRSRDTAALSLRRVWGINTP